MNENDFDAESESFKNGVASYISKEPEKIQGMEILLSRYLTNKSSEMIVKSKFNLRVFH